ncbi:hypothetical protein WCLP8_1300007 [uncultured Gammaproteobacteria bacterium]
MAELTLKTGTPTGNPPSGYLKLFIADDGRLTGRDSTGASVLVLGGINTGDQGAYSNLVINGCCRVSHRASKTLSTSWQTGPVDLIAAAAGGTVGAGTIVQATGVTSLSKSGYACQVQSVTLTGSGAISWRHRIEARNAVSLANGAAMVTARTYHDVGSAVTYSITVNKPTAADNFASVTQIATGTVSVANATNADVSLSIANLGDCSNGLEIIISAACGAVTTKNFNLGDVQLVAGTLALPMAPLPIATEVALVARYLRPCSGLIGKANSATNIQIPLSHPDMRAAPTYEATAALNFTDAVSADFAQSQASITTVHDATAHNGRVSCAFFSGLTSGTILIQRGSGGTILASAEL